MKAEFLQLWDGMLSEDVENKYGIVVVGATWVIWVDLELNGNWMRIEWEFEILDKWIIV